MGYYLTISYCDLKNSNNKVERMISSIQGFSFNKLEYFKKDKYGRIKPKEYNFKSDDLFEEELVLMSRAGIKGKVILFGEEGEYYKYVLDGKGKVRVYDFKRVIFYSKPSDILGG